MTIYIITTLFVYAVSLHKWLRSGGTPHIMSQLKKFKVGAMLPCPPVSCTHVL